MADEILLESGTNEVEVLEFYLGDQSYGINVAKVLQIELFDTNKVTKTPGSGDGGVLGVYMWRDETVSLLDLSAVLDRPKTDAVDRPLVLVTEFNAVKNAFLVDGVNQVYRVGWNRMEPISGFLGKHSSRTNATLHVEKSEEAGADAVEILMLDFESIIAEYSPDTNLGYGRVDLPQASEPQRREMARIVMAEDSAFLRQVMERTLREAQYNQLTIFENGQLAHDHIVKLKTKAEKEGGSIKDFIDLVITDIEMPLMDGLTLCRRIKKDYRLDLPVIFFSSLINEQMKLKCADVGGDAQITKPEIARLVSLVDGFCLKSA